MSKFGLINKFMVQEDERDKMVNILLEKRLDTSVIITVPFSAHAAYHVVVFNSSDIQRRHIEHLGLSDE